MIRLAALLLLLCFAGAVRADELRPGYIELTQRDAAHWSLGWKQPLSTPGPAELVVPRLPDNCRVIEGPHRRLAQLALVGSAELACEGSIAGRRAGLDSIFGRGDVLLRVAPLGGQAQSYRLTAAEPVALLASKPSVGQVWRSYFELGVEHILEGWDHLLFVIALVLIVRRGWAVAKAVTAFTIAHSLTLAGATLGVVGLPGSLVEPLIALSIMSLAVELVRRGEGASVTLRYPWAIAFAFGLVHGFGFAGALAEIGLPDGEVPAALLAFNFGVEAGQLAVVAVVLTTTAAVERLARPALAPAVRFAAYGVGITASFWLIDRLVA